MIVLQAKLSNALFFRDSVQEIDSHLPENRFKVMWFLSTGFSSAAPTSSRQLRTRRVSKASSATWTWALRAPESCWCPEFNWPKRRCRDFCPAVLPQVRKTLKHTGFYFSGACDPVMSLCSFICLSRSESAPGCGFCRTIWGVFAQRLRVHRRLRKGDECRSKCLVTAVMVMI